MQMQAPRRRHPRRFVVFDLDGTLIDSGRLTCAIINQMLADRQADQRADPMLVRAMDAAGGEAMIAAVMGRYCREPAAEIAEFRARHALVDTPADLGFPGVGPGLAALGKAGFGMAICSNKPQALCEKILGELGLTHHFSAIVGSRSGVPRKPAPDAIQGALSEINADPAATVYIGDTLVDLQTAAGVGIPFLLAGWGYGVSEVRAYAPEVKEFSSMADLVQHLLQASE